MTRMIKEEEEKLISENPHLNKYLEEIQNKMNAPVFYSMVPRDLKEEKYPNIIVRVWGWSGYFNELDLEYENHILNRAGYKD